MSEVDDFIEDDDFDPLEFSNEDYFEDEMLKKKDWKKWEKKRIKESDSMFG